MKYATIDIETTGLNPRLHSILEIGIVIEDTQAMDRPISELPRFHCYVLPPCDGYLGDPIALSMNAKILQRIADYQKLKDKGDRSDIFIKYLEPHMVHGEIYSFIFKEDLIGVGRESASVIAAGKNFGNFDRPFLEKIPDWRIKFKHRVLDPMMYYLKTDDEVPPDLKTCKERAGMPPEVAHTAIEDCLDVIQLIRIGMKRQPLM
jgi:oligoribonuclease